MATHWQYDGPAQSGVGTRWRRTAYAQDGYGNRCDYTGPYDLGANFTMSDLLFAPPGILPNGRTQITVSDFLQIMQGPAGANGTNGTDGAAGKFHIVIPGSPDTYDMAVGDCYVCGAGIYQLNVPSDAAAGDEVRVKSINGDADNVHVQGAPNIEDPTDLGSTGASVGPMIGGSCATWAFDGSTWRVVSLA